MARPAGALPRCQCHLGLALSLLFIYRTGQKLERNYLSLILNHLGFSSISRIPHGPELLQRQCIGWRPEENPAVGDALTSRYFLPVAWPDGPASSPPGHAADWWPSSPALTTHRR